MVLDIRKVMRADTHGLVLLCARTMESVAYHFLHCVVAQELLSLIFSVWSLLGNAFCSRGNVINLSCWKGRLGKQSNGMILKEIPVTHGCNI